MFYTMPYLVYDSNIRQDIFLKINKLLTFTPEYISKAMSSRNSFFNLLNYLDISVKELFGILLGDIVTRWRSYFEIEKREELLYHRKLWHPNIHPKPNLSFKHELRLSKAQIESSKVLTDLLFVREITARHVVYTHQDYTFHSMQETVEHRNIRYKKERNLDEESIDVECDRTATPGFEFPHIKRPSRLFCCEKTEIPSYLFFNMPKVLYRQVNLRCVH